MKIFLLLILFSLNSLAKSFFNFSYNTSSVLVASVLPNKSIPAGADDPQFRHKSLGYDRYEFSYQSCSDVCFSYGLGLANEKFTIAKYDEALSLYASYKLTSNYIYGSFELSKDINENVEFLGYANLGSESFSLEKDSGTQNGNATESYVRTEVGGAVRYHFVKLPSIKIERIYLEGGLSLYLKSIGNISFDNQSFDKTELMTGNILINIGAGISF